jgi:hypothetical protein
MSELAINNIFLADENVNGKAIEIAQAAGVQIIRDQDLDRVADLNCTIQDYDQCLFDYAVANGYVIVTGNRVDFEPKFYQFAESGTDHPGLVLIRPEYHKNGTLIAEWLQLLADQNLTNKIERIPPP